MLFGPSVHAAQYHEVFLLQTTQRSAAVFLMMPCCRLNLLSCISGWEASGGELGEPAVLVCGVGGSTGSGAWGLCISR